MYQGYPLNEKLCILNALQCYLGMPENLVDANTKEFIISYGKPHKPASSDTTSRWIKDKLGMAGINTNVYKPHSCWSATTSRARDNGLQIFYNKVAGKAKLHLWNSIPKKLLIKRIVGKTWIIQNFFLNNKKFTNSIHLFIYFHTHRLIHDIYNNGVANLKSSHKCIMLGLYMNLFLSKKYINIFPKYLFDTSHVSSFEHLI